MKRVLACVLCLVFSGCRTFQPHPPPGQVPVHTVVDKLKSELNLFNSSAPTEPATPFKVCGSSQPGDKPAGISIVPVNAELALKVTSTSSVVNEGGLKIPIGSVITVKANHSETYSTSGMQALTLNLDIAHELSVPELQAEVDRIEKETELYKKLAAVYAKDDDVNLREGYRNAVNDNTEKLKLLYRGLANAISDTPPKPTYDPQEPGFLQEKDHALAAALWKVRQELMEVDHDQKPCMKPSSLKTQIEFEVTDSTMTGGGIEISIISAGRTREEKTDTVQTLTVTFDMSRSTPVY